MEKIKGESLFRITISQLKKNKGALTGGAIISIFILSAVFAPFIVPHDPLESNLDEALQTHSAKYWLGTDEQGRDILSRIIYGGRMSLAIGVIAVAIANVLGVFLGLLSGFVGGKVDNIIMRLMDILMAFPGMLLALAIISALGPGIFNLMIAIGVYSIPTFARVVRGSVLAVKEIEYVEAARAIGQSNVLIIFSHILPNCVGPVLVLSTLRIATAILTGAGLSFLGLGPQPPTPEWGAMLSSGRTYLRIAPWVATYPGLAIMFVVFGFNIFGDGLRDALDPRLKT
ncbi:MAG: ABC transporter permease [Deltaproteobacteria bacterium]|nr:ABC transporter permease [Deltaproteobacteria bacterium]MBW2307668.1 ABC transporter permease [Deltaproteobacteria bacterium]